MRWVKVYIPAILLLISALMLVSFLYMHWQLGLTRYFDADEFAHLHWAAKMLVGKKPYIDFQSFFPPGFAISLMPAFAGSWGTVQPFINARIMTFFIFSLMCLFSGLIFWEMRRNLWGAVLAAAILAFLPMPFDKYLEVRPDNLSTLLVLMAMYGQIKWMNGSSKKYWPVVAGVCYSVSYIVLPKTIPNILVGMLIAAVYVWIGVKGKPRDKVLKSLRLLKGMIIGLAVPMVLFGLWALTLGDLGLVYYSLFTLPVEANKISQYFIMMQDLFFYPNGIYYGQNGWSRGLYVNQVFWVIGIVVGGWRLVTPVNSVNKQKALSELLIALQFWVLLFFFIQIFPLKHAQYLIPIGVFIAWYAADLITDLKDRISGKLTGEILFLVLFAGFSLFINNVFSEVNTVKLGWTNKDLLNQTSEFYRMIPRSDYVLDLNGQMLYNPDAYYACCIPFGQSAEFYSRPLPDLPTVLEKTGTKYIAQGGLERVNTLPYNWQQYIYSHYRSYHGDKSMLVRNDIK